MNKQIKHYTLIYEEPQWPQIKQMLSQIASNTISKSRLHQLLVKFCRITNPNSDYSLAALFNYTHVQLQNLYSLVASFIISQEPKFKSNQLKIPLFLAGFNTEYTFQKSEILLLMCLMATCLTVNHSKLTQRKFPRQKDFSCIFTMFNFKIPGIINYLNQTLKLLQEDKVKLSLLRKHLTSEQINQNIIINNKNKLRKVDVASNQQSIQDFYGTLKVDFANKFIGGGALDYGNVQQEIMFMNHPEMYSSILLCDQMAYNESIAYIGFKKYYKTKGYGFHVEYDGAQIFDQNYDQLGRIKQYIVAIDALCRPLNQYQQSDLLREIIKSFCGFSIIKSDVITTGNWGCGVFGGDPQLKFLIQWLSCSLLEKTLIYCPFSNKSLSKVEKYVKSITDLSISVGQLYQVLCQIEIHRKQEEIFQFVYRRLFQRYNKPGL